MSSFNFYSSTYSYTYTNNSNLNHWYKLAEQYPCLEIEEELKLVEKVQNENCKESLDYLVLSNIGEVLNVLRQMKVPTYVDGADLVANTIPILYEKIPKFNLEYRKPLFSFLYYPVKWNMLDTLKSQNVVTLNVGHYTEIAKYNQICEDYIQEHGKDPDDIFIAETMGLQISTIASIRNRINVLEPVSLNFEIDEEYTIQDTLECRRTANEKSRWEATEDLKTYLSFLPPQGQIVIILTEGPGIFDFDSYRLDDVAKLLGLSRQRICMIKSKSLKRLKRIATLQKKEEKERDVGNRFKVWDFIDLDLLKNKIQKVGLESKEERKDRREYEKKFKKK